MVECRGSYVDGKWSTSNGGDQIEVLDPSDGTVIASVPSLSEAQVLEAISSADRAFAGWSALPAPERSNILSRIAAELEGRADEGAALITREQGKPLAEARAETIYSAAYFQWFAEEARRSYGEIIPANTVDKRIMVIRQPVGVVAAITPWNFPLAMLARKMSAALAAGCTFIAKPAPETPLSALFLADVCDRAGAPAGVVNVIIADAQMAGELLMSSPTVRKVSFTGSTEVGKMLIRASAERVTKLTLELGGNAPLIVCDDADFEQAITGALFAKYRNAGQTCICINRFLVHEKVVDRFSTELARRSSELKVGRGCEPGVQIGPLISEEAVNKVARLIMDALARGARLLTPDACPSFNTPFVPPMVLCDVSPDMNLWKEEVFGPVSSITSFSSESEAIRLANDTEYGLAAYVYSKDTARAFRLAEQLHYGMVGVNDTAISVVQAPFGGVKESGYGREGGRQGMEEYQVLQYLSVKM